MNFQVQRESILKPLQAVIGVVERRQTLPVLSNILFSAKKDRISLTATDLEVELRASIEIKVEEPGDITLPARKLLDICRTLPEQAMLDFSIDSGTAQIKSGKSKFTLSTLPADEFPLVEEINTVQDLSLSQKDLKNLIERTNFSMAQQDVRYYLNGLMLELKDKLIRSVATDGHRLAICEMKADVNSPGSQQVIVPRKGIQELARLLEDSDSPASIEIGSNHIRVQLQDIRFTSKLIDGKFPDYQRVLPQGSDKHIIADRELFKQALVRTSILSNEKFRGIRFQLEKNSLRIQAHNPEQEEAEEEIEVEYTGSSLEIGFNVNYLLDALNALPGEQVKVSLNDPNSSCLIQQPKKNSDCRYVVMPMRL